MYRFAFFGLVLLLSANALAADDGKDPTSLAGQIETMTGQIAYVTEQRDKARQERKIKVLNCLDDRLKLLKAIFAVSQAAAARHQQAVQQTNQILVLRYTERVRFAYGRAKQVVRLADRCWEDPNALQAGTKISLKAPEYNIDELFGDELISDLEGNFGFPEIPPLSPFR